AADARARARLARRAVTKFPAHADNPHGSSPPRGGALAQREITPQQPALSPRVPAVRSCELCQEPPWRFSTAVWHSHYSQRGRFAVYLTGTIRARSGGLAMGAQGSRSRWLAFASVVAALTIAVASSDPAQA